MINVKLEMSVADLDNVLLAALIALTDTLDLYGHLHNLSRRDLEDMQVSTVRLVRNEVLAPLE